MRTHNNKKGFTLIEVLISMAIIAIMSTLIWGSVSQTSRNRVRLEKRIDQFHVYQIAMQRLSRELSMAYVSAEVNPDTSLQTVKTAFIGQDRSGGDRIDFTSFSHQRLYRGAHESDQNELSYFVTRHPEDSSIKVLARREQPRIDEDPQRGGRVEILVEDVEDFQIKYFDTVNQIWVDAWDSTDFSAQPNRLPTQVQIVLEVSHPSQKDETLTLGIRVDIPIQYALNHTSYKP